MEGRRTRGRAAAEKAAAANAAAGHVPQLSQPGEAETEDEDMNNEPWRRPVTASVLKGIMTIRTAVLRRQFGWRPHTGPPRIALSSGGQRLALGEQEVMQLNKEGRDSFPWKTHWVSLLVDSLGAQLDDTLLLQKQHIDGEGVIHVDVGLERAESSGSGGGAGIAAAARAAVGAALALAPRPSASSFGTAWGSDSEVAQQSDGAGEEDEQTEEQQEGEGDEAAEAQCTPPAKRRRSTRRGADDSTAPEAAAGSEGPSCRYCGRRHEERCPQQQAGKEQQQQHAEQNPQAGSSQNMDALLAAVEQAGAEPALQADAPAAAATEDSMAAAAAAPRLAAPGSSPVLAAHAAQAWQRQVDQALLAFEAGDRRSPESMLRPLRLLALVGNGGALLQGLLDRWGALSLERQQQVFDAVLVAAGQGAWEQLEARLRAALGRSDATSS